MKYIMISMLCLSITLMMAQSKVKLFDGTSLQGWHTFKKTTTEGWMVKDGGILTTDGKGGDLVTDKEYGDFVLEFDFMVSPKGNSGVIYKVVEIDDAAHFATYASAPEFQIIDDVNYPAKLNRVQLTGANYDMHEPQSLPSKPAGEWNHGKIQIKKNVITHWVNGKKVVKYTYGDSAWSATVAKSKFAKWPYANAHHKGKIALQGHNDVVSFKNITIKE